MKLFYTQKQEARLREKQDLKDERWLQRYRPENRKRQKQAFSGTNNWDVREQLRQSLDLRTFGFWKMP